MTYEELKIKLDLYDPEDVLKSAGKQWRKKWFIVCDDGDCHLFKEDGTEDDIRKVKKISSRVISDIKKIVIPDYVTTIGRSAFWGCSELTSVTIPDSVKSIEEWAFACSDLMNIMIPDSVTNIGNYAFYSCNSLTSVSISDNVESIGSWAFFHCAELTSVVIPESVTNIGAYAFRACNKLKSLVFRGKTMNEVEMMDNYPWEIEDKSVIRCA